MSGQLDVPQEIVDGVEFDDKNLGPLLLKKRGDSVWLFRKGGDDQWVSMRPATANDLVTLGYVGFGWLP